MLRARHVAAISEIHLLDQWFAGFWCNRGKSPGTQVQHTLKVGTTGTGFRQFLASDCGTVWTITKSARTFAPFTGNLPNPLLEQEFPPRWWPMSLHTALFLPNEGSRGQNGATLPAPCARWYAWKLKFSGIVRAGLAAQSRGDTRISQEDEYMNLDVLNKFSCSRHNSGVV
jgi:hypothetical protein